jgi:hypothetical protein
MNTGRARRVLEGDKSTVPENVPITIDGNDLTVPGKDGKPTVIKVGCDGITMDAKAEWLYDSAAERPLPVPDPGDAAAIGGTNSLPPLTSGPNLTLGTRAEGRLATQSRPSRNAIMELRPYSGGLANCTMVF